MSNENNNELPRTLGLATATATVIGAIIGSGIFRVPAEVATQTGTAGGMLLVWIVGGLLTLCLALSLSEVAALFPRAGGVYVYVRESWGNLPAFLVGWTWLLISPAGWAAIAMVCAEYVGHFLALTDTGQRLLAIAMIVLLTAANYRSVVLGAAIQNLFTFAKVVALVALVLLILSLGNPALGSFSQPVRWAPATGAGFMLALIAVLWAYDGVTNLCNLAGEITDPQRNVPRSLLMGVGAVTVIYLLINVAYLWVLPLGAVQKAPLVATAAASQVLGASASALIAALVIVSTFGALAVLSMADPRVFFAMGRDRNFFATIGQVHPTYKTPHIATLVAGGLGCVYVSVRTFEELAATFILGLVPFYALAVAGVMRLRKTHPDLPRAYRTPGYPWVPLAFILGMALMLGNALIETPIIASVNILVSLAGIPVYFVWKRFYR